MKTFILVFLLYVKQVLLLPFKGVWFIAALEHKERMEGVSGQAKAVGLLIPDVTFGRLKLVNYSKRPKKCRHWKL